MSETLVGTISTVDDVPAGTEATGDHPAGTDLLAVLDAGDFAEAGGMVQLAPGVEVAYSAADLDDDVLVLAEPLPVAVADGDPVHVWPVSPARTATVMVGDVAVQAVVPQSLLDQVPTGLRDDGAGETVTCQVVDQVLQVTDLVRTPDRTVKEGAFRTGDVEATTGGLHEDGSADITDLRAQTITVDGVPLSQALGPVVLGLGTRRTPRGTVYGPYSTDMSLLEAVVDVPAGWLATLDVRGHLRAATDDGSATMRLFYTVATGGASPARPVPDLATEVYPTMDWPRSSRWSPVTWSWDFGPSVDARYRVLLWIGRAGVDISARDFHVTLSMAPARAAAFETVVRALPGGQTTDPPEPPPPLATRTTEYAIGAHVLWASGVRAQYGYRLQDVQAGRSDSGQLWTTYLRTPPAALAAVASAEELVEARIRLAATTTLPVGGHQPWIATAQQPYDSATQPSPRYSYPGSRTYTASRPSGWTVLDSGTLAGLRAGDPTLVVHVPSSVRAGRYHGPGASSALRPVLQITTRSRT